MKQDIKIILPAYKIFYSVFFPIVLCLIRGVTRADEIGGALDSNIALLAVQICYLCLLSYAGYFFYYWQRPTVPVDKTAAGLYGSYLIAITATVIFWSFLSVTISSLFRSQWAGIGISFLLWLTLYSKAGEKYLGNVTVQTSPNCYCIRPIKSQRVRPDACCHHVFLRSAQ